MSSNCSTYCSKFITVQAMPLHDLLLTLNDLSKQLFNLFFNYRESTQQSNKPRILHNLVPTILTHEGLSSRSTGFSVYCSTFFFFCICCILMLGKIMLNKYINVLMCSTALHFLLSVDSEGFIGLHML